MSASTVIAGYQGEASILTAALRTLADALGSEGWSGPLAVQPDVTQTGETAGSLFASLESGTRHLGYMASGYLSHRVPELQVLDLPFAVSRREQALQALDGAGGDALRTAVERETGLRVLAFWDNGFRHVSNAVRPLRTTADCRGLVIRTLDSAVYREALTALGFQPMTTDVKDLVRVVQDGTVQAQENPLTNLLTFSLWRHHPHVSLTGHFFGVLLLVCPREWHEALPPAQRTALEAAVGRATREQRRLAAAQDEAALATLRAHGVQVLQPQDIDLPALHAATEPIRLRLRERLPSALVRAYLGPALEPEAESAALAQP